MVSPSGIWLLDSTSQKSEDARLSMISFLVPSSERSYRFFLDKVDSQHQLKIVGLVSAHSFIIARLDQLVQLLPRQDGVHLFEKFPLVRFYFF